MFSRIQIILFILISNCAFGQRFTIERQIKWQYTAGNDNQAKQFHFEHAMLKSAFYPLPHYSENIPVDIPATVDLQPQVDIRIIKHSRSEIAMQSHSGDISHNIKIDAILYLANGDPYLCVEFFPFYKDKSSGSIQRVDAFHLEINFTHINPKQTIRIPQHKNSVLAGGKWYRIAIETDGIYKVSFDDLKNMGFDQPEACRFFSNFQGQLSYYNTGEIPVGLVEIAVWVKDSAFYFFGKSPHYWTYNNTLAQYEFHRHIYSNKAYYFITNQDGTGKRIPFEPEPLLQANAHVYTFDDHFIHEKDPLSLIRSGRNWYGEHFDVKTKYSFKFSATEINITQSAGIKIATIARSGVSYADNFIQIDVDENIGLITLNHLPVDYSNTSNFATQQSAYAEFIPVGDTISVSLTYNKLNSYSEAWLDYMTIQFRRKLKIYSDIFFFKDVQSVANGNIAQFHLQDAGPELILWDITDHQDVREIDYELTGTDLNFVVQTDSLRTFVVFNPGSDDILHPELIGPIDNQNLQASSGCELLIVTPKAYLDQANKLADFHQNQAMQVQVVTPQVIYNEFSTGAPDVSAIRNFIRYLYKTNTDSLQLQYVLLFGDGSYDMRPGFFDHHKLIPGYQSANSLLPTESFITDDFYGLMDNNEGGASGLLDLGVGRLPVSSVNEAATVVQKIIDYHENHYHGGWQQDLLFIADEGNYNIHLDQAENLTGYIDTAYPQFNIRKIYFDAYPYENNSVNLLAKEEINREILNGRLIINYTGHGSELGLGSSNVISISDIINWNNYNKPTIFMTATCEFSRFDDTRRTSAGELIILNPKGGGAALFTTTRLVYSTPNFILNKNFYKYVFEQNGEGKRLGDIMMKTKIASGQGNNKRNFTLLGDPAAKIAMPLNNIVVSTINNHTIDNITDTFFSFSKIKIMGWIESDQGILQQDYNGVLDAQIFDQPVEIRTLGENESLPAKFNQFENVLFNGKASVSNGKWVINFMIPADINQNVGYGKMSFFANDSVNGNNDAGGYFNEFLITGSKHETLNDYDGPEIKIFLDDLNFVSGNQVGPSFTLIVLLSDSSGINTTGHTIGRNITAWIDTKDSDPINLNSYYKAGIDNYQTGRIDFDIGPLSLGSHSINLKAWDIANNPTEEKIDFEVSTTIVPEIKHVFNYPNPFTQNTSFYFEHNLEGIQMDVSVDIYTVSGRIIRHLESSMICDNSLSNAIFWDGLDEFGNKLGRSVYFYRLKIITEQGFVVEKIEKLVSLK